MSPDALDRPLITAWRRPRPLEIPEGFPRVCVLARRRQRPPKCAATHGRDHYGRGLVRAQHSRAHRGGAAGDRRRAPPLRPPVRARPRPQRRGGRRSRVPGGDREPLRARRPLPPVAARAVRGGAGADDDRRLGGRRHRRRRARSPGTSRSRASAWSSRSATSTCRSSTRSSTRCLSPTWRRWCGRRTGIARRSTRCAGWRRSCSSTPRTSPTSPGRWAGSPRCPRTPTWSTSRGCARRRGASAWRPPSTRRRCATRSTACPSVTVRHREDSLSAALLFCGWLSSRLGWKPGSLSPSGRGHSGHARARRQEVKIRLEPIDQNAPGLGGRDDRDGVGRGDVARPGARRAARGAAHPRRERADLDRARRLARRGRHPRRGRAPGAAPRPDLPACAGLRVASGRRREHRGARRPGAVVADLLVDAAGAGGHLVITGGSSPRARVRAGRRAAARTGAA